LFLLPIWITALTFILRRFYPNHRLRTLFGLSFLGCSVHLFFDLVNSFGVVLFWPISDWRPELAIVFIIDLSLTGLLAAPLLISISKRIRPHLVRLSRLSVACVAAYIIFCGANRFTAKQLLMAEAQAHGIHSDFSYVFSEPFGPHRWKGVLRESNIYRVYLIHSLTKTVDKISEVRTEADNSWAGRVRATALGHRIEWFFKAPVWNIKDEDPNRKAAQAEVYDLRFQTILVKRGTPFTYRFDVHQDGTVELLP
jgi:hypothetical protein